MARMIARDARKLKGKNRRLGGLAPGCPGILVGENFLLLNGALHK
jgi:hypothetical protein